jgi:hypothetical protein
VNREERQMSSARQTLERFITDQESRGALAAEERGVKGREGPRGVFLIIFILILILILRSQESGPCPLMKMMRKRKRYPPTTHCSPASRLL